MVTARRYRPPGATIDPDPAKGWLRRIAPVVAPHRTRFAAALLLALVALVAQVAIPAVIRAGVDDALVSRTRSLSPYLVALGLLGAGRALLSYVYRFWLYRLAFQLDTDLRVLLFDHVSGLDWSYFDRTASGQLISRANSDIRSVQMFLTFAPLLALTSLQFFVAAGFMASIHLGLTLVAVATLPGVYVLGVRLRNEVFPLSWIVQGRQAEVATVVDENIGGVRVVRAFAAEPEQMRALARAASGLRWASVRQVDARARLSPLIENLPRIGMGAVLVYGGWLVIEGRVTEGTLFAFTAYVTQLQAPFRTFGLFLMLGQRARASAGRIYEVLDERSRVVERPGAVDLVDPVGAIEFVDVGFSYGTGRDGDSPSGILDGFTLSIAPGETVALVGRTGCGKSTVARLLGRFYEVDAGRVLVDHHDVRDLTIGSLRHHIGFCFDEPFLFSVPVGANIAYADPSAGPDEIRAAARDAEAAGFVEELADGYGTVVGERGYTLSGGQRQRVALARALLANPRILVLDDATSAIDAEVEASIHCALRARLERRTTILIAHRLSTIALADRVVLMEQGRVVATGTHAELLATEPRYAAVLTHEGPTAPGTPAATASHAAPAEPEVP